MLTLRVTWLATRYIKEDNGTASTENLMRRSMSRIVCALLLWSSTAATEAATYYVATNGNDSNPGTQASPWRTIQHAANVVNPGDIVNVRGGTYIEAVVLTRSGAVGNPITFQAFPGEAPILNGATIPNNNGFELRGASNVILDGFEITNFRQSSLIGGAIFVHDASSNSSTTIIRNNHTHHFTGIDNPTGIWVSGYAGTVEIANNTSHNNSGSANNVNNTGIVIFQDALSSGAVTNIIVHNNLVYNENIGIKYKHAAPAGVTVTAIIEKNIVHDITGVDSQLAGIGTEQNGTVIRNNIIYNVSQNQGPGVAIGPQGGGGSANNVQVYNNSMYNVYWGVYSPDTSHSSNPNVHDNIFFTVPLSGGIPPAAGYCLTNTSGITGMDYDYFAGGVAVWGCWNGSGLLTLIQLLTSGFATHSLTGNPLFVNPSGAPPDFHLQAGSPARNVGTGGLDMGAYPTGTEVIGPTSIGTSSPPLAPSNLTVR
ncbi:MAG: DUF1565 domain-containing protein [Nitrospirae bacterium]|nr:MAG: DUF1565 domain-containing protein [Nitrospirota bacterium]